MFSRLSIVVPAFNEQDGIKIVISTLIKTFPGAEIIIVDDGSSDHTYKNALDFVSLSSAVHLYKHLYNYGYGAALKTGMKNSTREFIAWFDADNEHGTEDLLAMYKKMEESHYAAIVGRRTTSMNKVRSIGKFVIKMIGYMLNFKAGNDLNCGLRIFNRKVILPYLSLLPNRYSASLTTTFLMIERGYPVCFYSITTSQRIGESKVKIKDGFAAMLKLLNLVMLFAPLRVFFKSGFFLLLLGTFYSILKIVIDQQGVPVLGLAFFICGIMMCFMGLIAEQISQLRLSQLEEDSILMIKN